MTKDELLQLPGGAVFNMTHSVREESSFLRQWERVQDDALLFSSESRMIEEVSLKDLQSWISESQGFRLVFPTMWMDFHLMASSWEAWKDLLAHPMRWAIYDNGIRQDYEGLSPTQILRIFALSAWIYMPEEDSMRIINRFKVHANIRALLSRGEVSHFVRRGEEKILLRCVWIGGDQNGGSGDPGIGSVDPGVGTGDLPISTGDLEVM